MGTGFDGSNSQGFEVRRRNFLKTTGAMGFAASLPNYGSGIQQLKELDELDQSNLIELEWEMGYGGKEDEEFRSVINVGDGFLTAGQTKSSDSESEDAWLLKVDKEGEKEWDNVFGGEDSDVFESVMELDKGYLAAGTRSGFGSGNSRGWLLRVDSEGDKDWEENFRGEGEGGFWSVTEANKGYLVSGTKRSSSSSTWNGWLVKVDSEGDKEWETAYKEEGEGGFWSVTEVNEGFLAVGGIVPSSSKVRNGWMMKVDREGEKKWEKVIGGDDWLDLRSVIDTDERYLAAGILRSSDSVVGDGWLVKVDDGGETEWEANFGGDNDNWFNSVVEVNNGYLAAGETHSSDSAVGEGWLVKVDKQGNKRLEKIFKERNGEFTSVTPTNDGYLAAGKAYLSSSGNRTDLWDAWLVKFLDDSQTSVKDDSDDRDADTANNSQTKQGGEDNRSDNDSEAKGVEQNSSSQNNSGNEEGSGLPGFGVAGTLIALGLGTYKSLSTNSGSEEDI